MAKQDFTSYLSPFSWRYGSQAMRTIFSEEHKYKLWRKVWVTLAKSQYDAGLITKKELNDLKRYQNDITIDEILSYEKETKHDVVAAIREFAGKANIGGGKIHLGATSMDIVDNAEAIRVTEALSIIEDRLGQLLLSFADNIEENANLTCMGYTHLQPAEPTTVGYRLSFYAQELLIDRQSLQFVKQTYRAKGMKGAVGTAASYASLLKSRGLSAEVFEKQVMDELGIVASAITSQVNSRKYDYLVLFLLAGIAQSLHKFASDVRMLQSPAFGEWSEPFAQTQVGSSAMPFKRNPRISENICSLARFVMHLPEIGLENAAHSYLERTLDDSANRRSIIPEAFLATDEVLTSAKQVIDGLEIHKERIAYNLSQYGPFASMEPILLSAVKNGANRQETHELLRVIALRSFSEVEKGHVNPIINLLCDNAFLRKYLSTDEIIEKIDVTNHIGNAPKRAKKMAKDIRKQVRT